MFEETPLISSTLFSYLNEYYSLSYPNEFIYSIAHIHHENDFWINRTLINRSPSNQIEFQSLTNVDELFSILFNQSSFLPLRKVNELYFLQDFQRFQLLKSSFNQPLFRQFQINIRSPSTNDNRVELDLTIANRTIIRMKFSSNIHEEYQHWLDSNLAQMITTVWQYERTYLMENARLFHLYTWSPNEIDEIISQGYLNNYTIVYRYDPWIYPEIVDDPSNYRFQMKI